MWSQAWVVDENKVAVVAKGPVSVDEAHPAYIKLATGPRSLLRLLLIGPKIHWR